MRGGELRRGKPAERVPGDVCAVELGRVEPAGEPVAELVRTREAPQRGQVDDVEPPVGRKRLEQGRPPAPRAAEPVHEQQGRPVAGNAVANALAVDLDGPELEFGRPAGHERSLSGGRGVVPNG